MNVQCFELPFSRKKLGRTSKYSNIQQPKQLAKMCVCVCVILTPFWVLDWGPLYMLVYIYIYICLFYIILYACTAYPCACRQGPFFLRHVLHIPTVFHIPSMILETKDIDANIPKCFRDGTAMYSWDSKSPTWAAQVKLAFFCRATCQSLPIGTYFFWIGWCFF